MFTTSYNYLVYVIPYLVVAPLYFSGELNLGSITQSTEAFYHIRSDFSIIINYFEKLSAFAAGVDRLSTFIHRINQGGWRSNSLGNAGMYFMFELTTATKYLN
jgi:putative ATP-binding cassette transporter